MKLLTKLLILAALILCIQMPVQAHPFYKRTKHKTVKRMKPHQVRKIQKGENFYIRVKNKVKKNL